MGVFVVLQRLDDPDDNADDDGDVADDGGRQCGLSVHALIVPAVAHFIFPQSWIAPAITAAALAFGPLSETTRILYRNLPGQSIGGAVAPNKILIDKKPASEWPRNKAQCVIAHEYGHLRGREHSENPRSIMYFRLTAENCQRFLDRHGL